MPSVRQYVRTFQKPIKCGQCGGEPMAGQRRCKKCHAEYMRNWRKTHPLNAEQRYKDNARSTANSYKAKGKLVQQPCAQCGSLDSQMHHEDYSKPLDVTWLCRPCHLAHHKDAPEISVEIPTRRRRRVFTPPKMKCARCENKRPRNRSICNDCHKLAMRVRRASKQETRVWPNGSGTSLPSCVSEFDSRGPLQT